MSGGAGLGKRKRAGDDNWWLTGKRRIRMGLGLFDRREITGWGKEFFYCFLIISPIEVL